MKPAAVRQTLAITLLALANLALVALVVAGLAAILHWAHPDATDMAQWVLLAILLVWKFLPDRRGRSGLPPT